MLPYYLLTGASLAGGALPLQRLKYRWGYLLTMGLACGLLASLRYVTGFDYRFYESVFQSIAVNGLEGADWSEPGYLLLNLAVSLLWNDYRVFLFAFHFLLTDSLELTVSGHSPEDRRWSFQPAAAVLSRGRLSSHATKFRISRRYFSMVAGTRSSRVR